MGHHVYPSRYIGLSFLVMVAAALSCNDSKVCPPEKPFCTPIGCIEVCPKNTFENGTQCVTDCGEGVVDGNKCKHVCPPYREFIEERDVVYGDTFRRFRFCLSSCDKASIHSLFAYNNICVRVCPARAAFIIDRKCSLMCPDSHSFKYENQQNEFNVTNVVCLRNCPVDRPYSKNLTCLSECSKDEVLFDHNCISECPNSSYVVFENMCMVDCPAAMYKLNSSCVQSCNNNDDQQPHMLYIFNKTCVENCPLGYNLFWNTSNGYRCVQDCGKGYHIGSECTTECDHLIANSSCVQTCPVSMPFQLSLKGYRSKYGYIFEYVKETCVSNCPDSQPFKYEKIENRENETSVVCLKKCPSDKPYLMNKTCVSKCFQDKMHMMYVMNDACLEKCPGGYNYVWNTSYGYRCVKDCGYGYSVGLECVNKCGHVVVNGSCRQQCPDSEPFQLTVSDNSIRCVSTCPAYRDGSECVYKCNHVVVNGSCLQQCPPSAPFQLAQMHVYQEHKRQNTCLPECPDKMFYYNYTCVNHCPHISYNKTCLNHCPVEAPFTYGSICLDECPVNTFKTNLTCLNECTKLVFNNQCLDKCPPIQPYTEYDILGKHGKCVEKCGVDKLAKGTTCIHNYECKKPITFNGQCLDVCPGGTFWVGTSVPVYNHSSEDCLSPRFFYYMIIGSLILIALELAACIKCYRFRCSRLKQKKLYRTDVSLNLPLLNDIEEEDDTVRTCRQNNAYVV